MLFGFAITFAQEKTISGTVSDGSGLPLPGATVLIKGTTSGTTSDFDGKYSIKASQGATLVFSFVGYTRQEVKITNDTINITMTEDAESLEEVVITAMGIRREARSIGYGISTVKGEELLKARESNIVNSLQGKLTGVQITNTGGNLGGSSKIVIRGVSSLSGRNNPLWVVDGVLINDSQTSSNNTRISGNRDFANGAAAINPDDVESLSVLKGAAATALYGSRAAAGAIIVTTKRGKVGAGATVTVNSSVRFEDLFRTPDYQQEYASGTQGQYDPGTGGFDWGPRIVGQIVPNLAVTGVTGPLTAVKNNGIDDFFKTGVSKINNFAISDATEKMDYRLSLTSFDQTGILPGASLERLTVGLNAGVKHNEKLRSRFSVQYTSTSSKGTGATGANDPNIISLTSFSSTLDQNLFKPWKDASGNQINVLTANNRSTSNNPLWLRNENASDRDDDRFFGNYEIAFTPIESLSFTGRVGMDLQDDRRLIENSVGTITRLFGDYNSDNIRRKEITVDLYGAYNKNLAQDLNLNLIGGFQYNSRVFERQQIQGVQLSVPELFSPGNALQTIAGRDFAESRLIGLYGSAELSYKDWATLTVTGRNDYSSTLPIENNSYFYPSVSLAFVFSDAFNLSNSWFDYGKLRGSWAKVGNDTGAYQLDFAFNPITTATAQYSLDLNFPLNGALGYSASATIPAANLLPEEQTSYEIGLELKFLKGRIGFDAAYFKNQNENQILAIPIPESTGFGFRTENVGRVDQEGFELAINAIPLKIGDFSWNTNINFSNVESKVVSLTNGLESVNIQSGFSSVSVVAVPGKPFQLRGIPFLRDEASGRPIIDPLTGRRQAGQVEEFGSVLPKWTAGFVNSFSYKGFNLSATIDMRWGGVMKSSTVEDLQQNGLVKETLLNREGTFIDTAGVLVDAAGNVTENDVPLINAQDFWQNSLGIGNASEAYIFDASYAKLREVSFSYTFSPKLLNGTFIKGLSVGVEGRNLALLYSKVPHIDPEANLFGSGSDGFGVERASIPSTTSIGFNVRLTF
jgi:TonB-linked SusC/RagA family outer membrane protein